LPTRWSGEDAKIDATQLKNTLGSSSQHLANLSGATIAERKRKDPVRRVHVVGISVASDVAPDYNIGMKHETWLDIHTSIACETSSLNNNMQISIPAELLD
jgi:hypothetical protein